MGWVNFLFLRLGQLFLFWVWVWKISPKISQIIQFFLFELGQKGQGQVSLLFTAGLKDDQVGSRPISTTTAARPIPIPQDSMTIDEKIHS